MVKRLRNGDIGIGKFHILAHHGNLHLCCRMIDLVDHLLPAFHVRRAIVHVELGKHDPVQPLLLHHKGNLVDAGGCAVLDDGIRVHVAEQGNLLLHLLGNGLLRAADEDVRLNADGPELLDAVLGRLCLEFPCRGYIRKQSDVDVEDIVLSHLFLDLPYGLKKGLALDVAHGTADFRDDHICAVGRSHIIDTLLDLIGDVRDDLHRTAEIVSLALLGKH